MIEWTITSSALILLVLLLRAAVKDRVSPRLPYGLWGLVLVRLVVPVSLCESPVSVMTPVAAQEVYRAAENIPWDIQIQEDGSAIMYSRGVYGWGTQTFPAESVESGKPVIFDARDGRGFSIAEQMRQVQLRDAVLYCWGAGIITVGVFLLAVNLKSCIGRPSPASSDCCAPAST